MHVFYCLTALYCTSQLVRIIGPAELSIVTNNARRRILQALLRQVRRMRRRKEPYGPTRVKHLDCGVRLYVCSNTPHGVKGGRGFSPQPGVRISSAALRCYQQPRLVHSTAAVEPPPVTTAAWLSRMSSCIHSGSARTLGESAGPKTSCPLWAAKIWLTMAFAT